jgi:hypothetical protein
MAFVAALAYDALSHLTGASAWTGIAFASTCCAIIGWPLSRCLSRYLVCWEAREPRSRVTERS